MVKVTFFKLLSAFSCYPDCKVNILKEPYQYIIYSHGNVFLVQRLFLKCIYLTFLFTICKYIPDKCGFTSTLNICIILHITILLYFHCLYSSCMYVFYDYVTQLIKHAENPEAEILTYSG